MIPRRCQSVRGVVRREDITQLSYVPMDDVDVKHHDSYINELRIMKNFWWVFPVFSLCILLFRHLVCITKSKQFWFTLDEWSPESTHGWLSIVRYVELWDVNTRWILNDAEYLSHQVNPLYLLKRTGRCEIGTCDQWEWIML